MLHSVHELEVGSEILECLVLLAFVVKIPEVELEVLLGVYSSDNHESTLRRPVDGVAVLLVECADVLEVANRVALLLLRAEEGDGCLWWHSSTRHNLASRDDDETVALWLPCEIDDGVLERVHDLDWDVLLVDTEDFQVRGKRLL